MTDSPQSEITPPFLLERKKKGEGKEGNIQAVSSSRLAILFLNPCASIHLSLCIAALQPSGIPK